ncbi:hypothetical protein FOPG_17674 [Fusarium oxysporum f. sp. conglutinans race 2 54008]|uniref:Uncharacterized protein n=1 Tax=Fusarium oxysporum f. sp. conglutinans race 2 54008 TaxID=1089457 RepID=X0H241_FUSOX|nr:hypothetical protein FOPG_17674 [Fusarium oxysporum f. sp. conglutinans race 2 54008]
MIGRHGVVLSYMPSAGRVFQASNLLLWLVFVVLFP